MKIAIISSGFLPVVDGVTVTVLQRLQKLSQTEHQILLFCPTYSTLADTYPNWRNYTGKIFDNVEIINLPSEPFMDVEFERNFSLKAHSVLLEKLTQFQPDLIHVDEPERISLGVLKFIGLDYAKKAKIPCVSFFHTNFIEYMEDFIDLPSFVLKPLQAIARRTIPWTYNAYDATLVASPTIYEKITRLGIKNAILGDFLGVDVGAYDLSVRDRHFFSQTYNLPDLSNQTKLVFLGRLTSDKGWNFTLDALPDLFQNDHSNTKIDSQKIDPQKIAILIAGDGDLREEIQQRLQKLTPHVYFLGRIPPEAVPAVLINSDIHVTTSEKETRGLTVLEAFAAGIAVLAPRSPGIIDSLKDGHNGWLFNPQNRSEFIQKLKHLIQDPTLRQQLGTQARQSVINYSWEQAVHNLVNVWQQQIQHHRK